ncbi:hypothetical protein BJ165DRAFT_1346215 [Panaeolus papilionaceus]|nr:hypothetical protein BJ165DRAFT_1346215 [Panaeolus papilionaceus]
MGYKKVRRSQQYVPSFLQNTMSTPQHNTSNENNGPATPSTPNFPLDPRHPSEAWLNNPGWMDGGHDPPILYFSHDQINAALVAAGRPPRPYPTINTVAQVQYDMQSAFLSLSLFLYTQIFFLGHHVNVTLFFTPPQPPLSGRNKAILKKLKITKMDTVHMTSISRVDFIKSILKIHGLDETFSPGMHSGPDFKLYYFYYSGGKSGAPSIQNDHQFSVALEALLKKDPKRVQVGVEIDVDDMEGYHIKQVLPPGVAENQGGAEEELVYGTRVPQVESYNDASQLHGRFVLELKKKWPCQQHLGEHGQQAYCYVNPAGKHIMLNLLRLKIWAAALAAADATKHEPPNFAAFDGAHDGSAGRPLPHGRTGPHPASAPLQSDPGRDAMAMLMTALLPVITGFASSRSHKRSHSTSSPPSTPKHVKRTQVSDSPIPEPEFELCECLRDFAELEGIDWTSFEIEMRMEEYTPDIIPFVSDVELCRITGASN